MRRVPSLVSLSAALLLSSALLPVGPAGAAPVYRTSLNGEIAFGEWSTCPTWQLGDHCLVTRVIAGDSRSRELNDFLDPARRGLYLHTSAPSLVLQHFWFDVVDLDGELSAMPTRESFGGVGVPGFPGATGNPAVHVDTRLRSGTASATDVTMHTTDYAGSTETWEHTAVSSAWTGAGALDRVDEGQTSWDKGLASRAWTRGWLRDVEATGQDTLTPQWGAFQSGWLFHGTQVEARTYKGPLSGLVTDAIQQLATGRPSAGPLVDHQRARTVHGEGAWTTCPNPQPGDSCRDVLLWYDGLTPVRGAATSSAGIEVDDYEVMAVVDGTPDLRVTRVVLATVPNAQVEAPRDLSGAKLQVIDADAQVCDENLDCLPATMSFSGTWTGVGLTQRFVSHSTVWGSWGREWSHALGAQRAATVTATVTGLPDSLAINGAVGGALTRGSLMTSVQTHGAVLRGP